MDDFKKQLRNRQLLIAGGMLGACSVILLTRGEDLPVSDFLRGFVDGFQVGLIGALFAVMVVFLIRNMRAMRDPELLKKLYIAETDERRLMIQQKAGSIGFSIALFGLVVATVVAGNFDITLFLTLLGATVFVSLIGLSLKLYYYNKF